MALYIDELALIIQQTIDDDDATREDWERAVDQAFRDSAPKEGD